MAARADTAGNTAADRSDTYETLMQVAWNFDYRGQVAKLDDLYNRAKENQWDAAELDWDSPIDPSNPIIAAEHSQYARMPFFQRLSAQQQEIFSAHSTAQLLSQFLHGEQGALLTAATVAHGVPDMKAKWYAATQTMDEARHVEAYDRYVNKIAIHYPMVPWLKQLIDTTLQTNNFCKVMIGMNMIIEGLALGAFNNMYKQTQEPLLKSITFNVMRDESRHVSFGHVYLTPTIAALHPDEREDLAQFAFDAVKILMAGQTGPMDQGFLKVLEVSGIDPEDFAAGMQEATEAGITRDLPPGQIHSLNDLMMPSLVRAGLVTPRTRELFESAGVPVNADLGILQAMEDSKSDMNVLNAEQAAY
ncbi:MAG: ferritin-like domain-containing protein [Gammaproteobacteria bacterium]|nr:ferritin-like domain-containing protein [Gammaproteobacteria bacterium]